MNISTLLIVKTHQRMVKMDVLMALFSFPTQLAKSIQKSVLWNGVLLMIFFTGCGLLDNDNKGRCTINCEDWQFMRIDKEPAWSPDGENIAFVRGSTEPGGTGIYLIGPDGENLRQIHSGVAGSPTWSPDGEWIAFHENAHIYKKHIETDSLVQLTSQGRNFHPAWSPDGEWIAYDRSIVDELGPAGVWIMEPNGSGKEYLYRARSPNWNPDGQSLIAWNGVKSTSIWKRFEIYFLNSSTPIQKLDAVVGDNRYPRYSPDGLKIIFASQPEGGGYHQVWVMDSNDTNTRQLTENGGWAADWSPDGEWIVFTETFNTGRLWLMQPDGSEKRQLTFD